jgi:hypothetical protein
MTERLPPWAGHPPRHRVIALSGQQKNDTMTAELRFSLCPVLTSLVGNPLPVSQGPSGTGLGRAVRLEDTIREHHKACALQGTARLLQPIAPAVISLVASANCSMLCWCVQPVIVCVWTRDDCSAVLVPVRIPAFWGFGPGCELAALGW